MSLKDTFCRVTLRIVRLTLLKDVCLSVYVSHSGIALKRLNISSKFFHRQIIL